MTDRPAVVWFRQDLRLADQAALVAAAEGGRPVLPLYVLDDESPGQWRMGGASRWWLHGSLEALAADLARLGSPLLLRRGDAVETVAAFARTVGAAEVLVTRHAEPHWRDADARLRKILADAGVAFRDLPGTTLFEPGAIRNRGGRPLKVFTPFWRACLAAGPPPRPLAAPPALRPAAGAGVATNSLAAWKLQPTQPDWAGGLREAWSPGEASAHARLAAFRRPRHRLLPA